ncbi:UDP-N-acetylmuramate dehydrogenase [Micrococcales bacterium 31B]|nr:UDP-N-acetylmuramate dehydrogenase [Micrococcales bacterium 31B]
MTQIPTRPSRLAELTTLRIGGPLGDYQPVYDENALIEAVRAADAARRPVLVLGGGSNLVCSDAAFDGSVIRTADPAEGGEDARGTRPGIALGCEADAAITDFINPDLVTPGVEVTDASACGGVSVTVWAGVNWDAFVAHAVSNNWVGIEALSGIPGTVGATPIQNVGAYGQDAAQVISAVRTWDREAGAVKTFALADCEFSYRHSIFKGSPFHGQPTGRYVVLNVQFQFKLGTLSAPVRYADLAARLGVEIGERVDLERVREAVLAVRGSKGMVLDPTDHDTWSAGSFFTNPQLTEAEAAALPEGAPRHPGDAGRIKTSAAWLISNSGLDKGFGLNERASLSTKHSLALTNRGGASASDIAELARAVRDRVRDAFGVELVPEPVWVGHSIND